MKVFGMCIANQVWLEPEWVPREENVVVDTISRIVDYDDWRLDPVIFNWLDILMKRIDLQTTITQHSILVMHAPTQKQLMHSQLTGVFRVIGSTPHLA